MALMLGIDTGGTFTDAVLVDDRELHVVAKAKAPTTHHDLTIGVDAAVRQVLVAAGADAAGQVALVSVSTTLATNALVEGHGDPAGLITFGFSARELERSGLDAAIAEGLRAHFDGGHDAHGNERTPIDEVAVADAAASLATRVSAFAVTAQFSVRNPRHEQQAAQLITQTTGLPVTTSHELSAKLDGPRRALTTVLNARLLGTIDRLNHAVAAVLATHEIDAPLMIVRGDGSLVSAAFAQRRPIETILSGPAASVIGALHLTHIDSGLVADIGGTTTDVAVISHGRPSIAEGGAVVGEHRTMVEAVDMATIGLGGDSEVHIDTRHERGPVLIGPTRAISLCRLALEFPAIHASLDRQLAAPSAIVGHGRFLVASGRAGTQLLDDREAAVFARLVDGPLPMNQAAPTGREQRAADRLSARGLVRVATMTPTDASAVLGSIAGVDTEAASKVATLLARQAAINGRPLAADAQALAQLVIDQFTNRSAEFLLHVALRSDGVDVAAAHGVVAASLAGHTGVARVRIGLSSPLAAIGAAAATYYHDVAAHAGTSVVVPDHADVANAIGAVVGRVRVHRSATITQPTRGQFRVHLAEQPTFGSVENARAEAETLLRQAVLADAQAAGAATPELAENWVVRTARINDREIFVEGRLTIEAAGRPRFSQVP